MKKKFSLFTGRALLTVLMVLVALGILLPTLLTVASSFMSQRELEAHYGSALGAGRGSYTADTAALTLIPQHATTEQYATATLQTPHYIVRFFNSLYLTVPITLGQLALAAMGAYSLYRCRNRFRAGVYFLYVLLMLLPYQVTLLPNYLVAKELGLLGSDWAVILPGIVSPFAVFLLSRNMRQIPHVQVEAAKLDGAGEWRIFTRICLPQCRAVLWAVAMLIFAEYWNMIEQPMVLLDDPTHYPLSIFLAQINTDGAGVAFAVAVLFMLPPLVLFLIGQRSFVAGFGGEERQVKHRRLHVAWQAAIVTVTIGGIAALYLVGYNWPTVNPKHTPTVTVAQPDVAVEGDTIYIRVFPREAVHEDDYGAYVMVVETTKQDGVQVHRIKYERVTVLADLGDRIALGEGGDWMAAVVSYDRLPAENSYVYLSEDGK